MLLNKLNARSSAPVRQLHSFSRHTPSSFRKRNIHIAHFRQGISIDLHNSIVRLPLEGQELLGLRKDELVKDSELNTVYEQLVGAGMEAAYSESAVNGRLEVLDFVRHDLITNKGRTRDSRQLDLPLELLPGALALMTEVGQCQLALDIAAELLRTEEDMPEAVRRDVLLSMALANCGLAGESLEGKSSQQLAQGCNFLEAALQALEAAGDPPLAPALACEIRQGLTGLQFQGALELLSGPTGSDRAAARKRALRVVRDALRPPPQTGLGLGGVRAAVSGSVGGVVATTAQSSLLAGPTVTSESMETLMGVLTCEEVVHLLEWEPVANDPAIYKWIYPGLLEAVSVAHVVHGFVCRQPAYIKMGLGLVQQLPATPDLHVVEGVCHVLLGAVNQAAEALKQAERFRGKGASGDRHSLKDLKPASGVLPASHDAYRFVVGKSAGSDDGLLPGLCMLTERWLTQAAFPFFRDTAGSETPSVSLVKYFDDTRVETLLTVYDAKSGGQLAETLSEAFTSIKRGLRKAAAAGLLATAGSSGAGEAGDAATGSVLAERKKKLLRVVVGGAALLAAVGVGLLTPPGQRLLAKSNSAQLAAVRQRAAPQPLIIAPEEFDAAVAKTLLERWQITKALALGASHATEQLDVLLAEPLLGETLDKVATLRSHGAHMRFKLLRLEVLGLRRMAQKTGPAVRINAQLEESADLHNDADGKPVNTCRRTYDAEYTVVQGRDGVWRMTSTLVVEREARD
ncbi:hypothetical protein VOLCADRAFT_103165 [Volvox carteri f. nagariensis]|uniref:Uncharacterized protein n=1 Tax=Volvox carteri f. nagariensis TaxID=3068 RepID=D8TJX0_VOLCA|nr:uncharacterized protein VOLCADRAFT_103165 [Volvox carteri f. nagariensis]EFJ52144.1 hypothetical protein VOLCADRAFT_103165 [Volvox carteri f. nagariensis]|eukprot:XP_002946918.1 hypothetical protein VOLCADRAFT_103165 [Volvox carteri f. nagariensis]